MLELRAAIALVKNSNTVFLLDINMCIILTDQWPTIRSFIKKFLESIDFKAVSPSILGMILLLLTLKFREMSRHV